MRFSILLGVFLILTGCSSPGKHFSGIDPVQISVDGSDFDVYVLDDEVLAIRMNFEMLPNIAVIGPRAIIAMERATGCAVIKGSFIGDQAMARARVSC